MKKRTGFLLIVALLVLVFEAVGYLTFRFIADPAHHPKFTLKNPAVVSGTALESTYFTEHDPWGVWHNPKVSVQHAKKCFDVTYSTNQYGARDEEWEAVSSGVRLIALGDSFLEGIGVDKTQRLDDLIEQDLNLEILNFGSAGNMGPLQYEIIFRELAGTFDHDGVLVFLLPDNDFIDNYWAFWKQHQTKSETRYRPYYEPCGDGYCTTYKTSPPARRTALYETKTFGEKSMAGKLAHLYWQFSWSSVFVAQIQHVLAPPYRVSAHYSGYMEQPDYTLDAVRQSLASIATMAGDKPVFLYVIPRPNDFATVGRAPETVPVLAMLSALQADHANFMYLDLAPAMIEHFEAQLPQAGAANVPSNLLDVTRIRPEIGHAYVTEIDAYGDDVDNFERSSLVLYEDGAPLGPAHTLHDTIREDGGGAFSHWFNAIYFSASDNSDPRTNGRLYSWAILTDESDDTDDTTSGDGQPQQDAPVADDEAGLFLSCDGHWSPHGHRIAADRVGAHLRQYLPQPQ